VFKRVTLRGGAGAILWGYRTAAQVNTWAIRKRRREWVLTAAVGRADAFQCRQRPLLFSAPRAGGFWVWPLVGQPKIAGGTLVASLGPPEQ
jgi:hypothetical protein